MSQRKRKSCASAWHKHDDKCQCVDEDSVYPVEHMKQMRRLRGPTIATATDGLTLEETRMIDINEFEVASRWRPYIAVMPNGRRTVLYRLRPKHHDQRSGGTCHEPQPSTSTGKRSFPALVSFSLTTCAAQQSGHGSEPGEPGPSGMQSRYVVNYPHDADNEDSDSDQVLVTEPEDNVVNNQESTSTLPREVLLHADKNVPCAIEEN